MFRLLVILFVIKLYARTDIWFTSLAVLFENLSHTEKSDNTVSAFITLLNMMLVSIVDCDKTLLALELVVDLSPMLDFIVEELSLLNPLQESWQVSSVESDFAAFVDDDFMQGLWKDNQIYWRIFIFCLWRSLWAWDFRASAAMFNFLSTFLKNVHLKLVPSDASANQSLYSSWSSHLFWKQVFYIFR